MCVSSLRRGHANLLCIVPILTDDPRRPRSLETGGPRIAGRLSPPETWSGRFLARLPGGGATGKVQNSKGLGLRKRVAAGRRALGHPRRLAGDMANAISSRRSPYNNGFRMPLHQGIRPQAGVDCIQPVYSILGQPSTTPFLHLGLRASDKWAKRRRRVTKQDPHAGHTPLPLAKYLMGLPGVDLLLFCTSF